LLKRARHIIIQKGLKNGKLPSIMIQIIADLHCHTIASTHAYSTVLENITYAKKKGLRCIAITDHASGITDAPHFWHFANIDVIPRVVEDIVVLRGAEVNILDNNGSIDLSEDTLRGLDWVNASFHVPTCAPRDVAYHTEAYLNIAKNPYVDVIAHSGTECFAYDYEKGIKAFKEYGKIVEFNNASFRIRAGGRKNCIEIAKLCKKYEVPAVVNSDAHFATSVGEFGLVLQMLEEIDFPEKLILNADEERFFGYIKEKKNIDLSW